MDDPPVPERFKGIPEAEKAWREGRRDGAELGRNSAAAIIGLYRLRWFLLVAAIVAAILIFR